MSWHLQYLKFKHSSNKLITLESELDFVTEVNKTIEKDFNEYQESWSKRNDFDLDAERKQKQTQIKTKLEQSAVSVVQKKKDLKCKKKSAKAFMHLYKLIAKKIHPDKFEAVEETIEIKEKKELFKAVSSAIVEEKWSVVLEAAIELGIKPANLVELNKQIEEELANRKKFITIAKATFSWKFYECEDDYECKDALMKDYIKKLLF